MQPSRVPAAEKVAARASDRLDSDGPQEITRVRASEIARMVMRDNAVALYRLDERR